MKSVILQCIASIIFAVVGSAQTTITLDNADAGFDGVWTAGNSAKDRFRDDYHFAFVQSKPPVTATYRPNIITAGKYDVEVYNELGEKIYSAAQQFGNSVIDLGNQPKGVYFMKVFSSEGVVTKKLVLE